MNSIIISSSLPLSLPLRRSRHCLHMQPRCGCSDLFSSGQNLFHISLQASFISRHLLCNRQFSTYASIPSNEGAVSVINFDDLMEKDWSFLEGEDQNSEELNQKIDRIISAGQIGETSKVMVSIASKGFVDRIVDSSACQMLLVVHDSLFVLASIKEKYDKVKCWQGELLLVPKKWAPFDVVFLYYLPALPFKLSQVFESLAEKCSPGARLVISHPAGREVSEQQCQRYPDEVFLDLPDEMTLQDAAANHAFDIVEFVEEPGFYLAVLKFLGNNLGR